MKWADVSKRGGLHDLPGTPPTTILPPLATIPMNGSTGYTRGMAKVMVSLPDDLLRAVDIEAGRRGTTRSGFLRKITEEELQRRSVRRALRMAEIDKMEGSLRGHGGGVAELVKTTRPER